MDKNMTINTQAQNFNNAIEKIKDIVHRASPNTEYAIGYVNLEPVYRMDGRVVWFEVYATVDILRERDE